ncbi:MAG: DNA mismatch repair protein MutL, partial [Treponema sp.]|nr:DNA mismatch repair protein MutL [Treponema sp.]
TESDLKKDLLDRRISPADMINAVAASTACRSAVMDGTVLDASMASWLCKTALALPDPHCPHGRPVYTTITRSQLFNLVRRT